MKTLFLKLFIFLLAMPFISCSQSSFKTEQRTYNRVRTAYTEKENELLSYAQKLGINTLANKLIIVGYKNEKKLEVWFKPTDSLKYSLFKEYDFCVLSGDLGPKREEGDGQVPEGFYYINTFNPSSSYYLSMQINYPNASDRILGTQGSLGGQIFIHGSCVSIGCIPITDEKIKELYVLCVEAKNAGQTNIPVYIFPNKMTDSNFTQLKNDYKDNLTLLDFWENLKLGFDKFQTSKKELNFIVDSNGKYVFK